MSKMSGRCTGGSGEVRTNNLVDFGLSVSQAGPEASYGATVQPLLESTRNGAVALTYG